MATVESVSSRSDAQHSAELRKAVIAATVGTTIEWYDFFIYGTAAGLVFGKLYFPNQEPLAATLAAFATYFVGFVGRPIGAAIFGHYGDRIGRKATLIATLMLMGIATFLIALVPTYASIGIWGAVLLTVLRVIQGIGLGFLFVPLSVVTLSTLSSELRAEGAGLYSLSRNIGSSVGISVVTGLLTRNTQVNHADIAQHVTAVNRAFEDPMIAQFWNPITAAGRAALDAVVTRQAQIIAYIDDYKLLMIATLAVIPLLIVFKKASGGDGPDHTIAVE